MSRRIGPVIAGFEWDEANPDKCRKRGVSVAAIEFAASAAGRGLSRSSPLARGNTVQGDRQDRRGPAGPDRVHSAEAYRSCADIILISPDVPGSLNFTN